MNCESKANPSGNLAAVGSVPAKLGIRKAHGGTVPLDCYSSVRNTSTGAYAERDITYQVLSQYEMVMSKMRIQERLVPASGSPCPSGTDWQSGLCVGAWIEGTFPDTLSAPPTTGHSEYTEVFWVTTLPNTPGYTAFYGQIPRIDAYQPSSSPSNSLVETLFLIKVNGTTGMNANGTPIRWCKDI